MVEHGERNLTTLLVSNFNFPNIIWSTPAPLGTDSLSSIFCEIVEDYLLHQLVLEPTRGNNIFDLILINVPEWVNCIEICDGLGNSDHQSIDFELNLKITRPKYHYQPTT